MQTGASTARLFEQDKLCNKGYPLYAVALGFGQGERNQIPVFW